MSEVMISINSISGLSNTMHEMQSDLNQIAENIRTIKSQLTGSSFSVIRTKLNSISTNVSNAGNRSAQYADTLQECARLYLRAETKAAGLSEDDADTLIAEQSINGYESDIKKWTDENGESIFKALISGSPLIKYIKSIYDLTGGSDGTFKDVIIGILNGSKDALAVLEKVYKEEPNGFVEILKGITGLSKYTIDGASANSSYLEYLKLALEKELSKYKIETGAAETGKSSANWFGAVAKYIGVAVEVITEGFENYDEFKDSGNWGRMIGETVIESGTDIGLGILAAAGIGAAMATVGAPAIVVAAAGAGVVFVANKACEWVTGRFFGEEKDIGEIVSDFVLDRGAAAINTIRDRAISAAEGVRNTAEAIGRGFQEMGASISRLFAW